MKHKAKAAAHKKHRHTYGINFILWVSFLAFAAVIILLTWLFQTMLLRVFFGAEMTDDLTDVGREAYGRIGLLMRIPGSEDEINKYIMQTMNENSLVTLYLLDTSGGILYPTEDVDPEGYGIVAEKPDVAVFRRAVNVLRARRVLLLRRLAQLLHSAGVFPLPPLLLQQAVPIGLRLVIAHQRQRVQLRLRIVVVSAVYVIINQVLIARPGTELHEVDIRIGGEIQVACPPHTIYMGVHLRVDPPRVGYAGDRHHAALCIGIDQEYTVAVQPVPTERNRVEQDVQAGIFPAIRIAVLKDCDNVPARLHRPAGRPLRVRDSCGAHEIVHALCVYRGAVRVLRAHPVERVAERLVILGNRKAEVCNSGLRQFLSRFG